MPVPESYIETISKYIPKTDLVEVVFEGPFLVLYVRRFHEYVEKEGIPRSLAQELKKRIRMRPARDEALDPGEARERALRVIPKKAMVRDFFFDEATMEMHIELDRPELIVSNRELLSELRRATNWDIILDRHPPLSSGVLDFIKGVLRETAKERRKFLLELGEQIFKNLERTNKRNFVRLVALGGYMEVGRSSTLLQTVKSRILVDFGMPMGEPKDNAESIPYLLHVLPPYELKPLRKVAYSLEYKINALVVTHAHMDHVGLVPLLIKLGYEGPVYLTKPTRDIAVALFLDYIKLSRMQRGHPVYDLSEVKKFLVKSIPLGYHETTDISEDVKLTFYNAGHILGSASAHFHVGEGLHNVVISGDLRYGESLLFRRAENRFPRVETLVMESTYGGRYQPRRQDAVKKLASIIDETVEGGGKVIVPVFAVGRSQEVMLAIEEAIGNGLMGEVPVFMDGMIDETTAIHLVYPEYFAPIIRDRILKYGDNPFLRPYFHYVKNAAQREDLLSNPDPLVVLTTSGMLTGGPVMEYLRYWGPNPNNALVFVGYQAEGTLGRRIQQGERTITMPDGEEISLKLRVETVDGFSGHSDTRGLLRYVSHMDPRPRKIVLCHGDENAVNALRRKLQEVGREWEVVAPRNLDALRLR